MSEYSTSSDRFTDDTRRDDDAIDLRGLIITMRKHRWPIILSTAVFTALTALVVNSITPEYRATSTLLFESNRSQTGFETPWAELENNNLSLQTQVEVLKSRTLAERLVRELNLLEHWEYNGNIPVPDAYKATGPLAKIKTLVDSVVPKSDSETAPVALDEATTQQYLAESAARRLMRQTTVLSLKQTNLVRVSVDGVDRDLAARIANGYGQAYIRFYLEQSTEKNSEAKNFLQKKVTDLKVKLDESEQRLLEERRRVGLSGDGGDISGQTIALFNNRLVDAKTRFEEARIQWDEVRQVRRVSAVGGLPDALNDPSVQLNYVGTGYELLPVVDSSPMVQRQKQLLQEAQRTLDELDNRYGERHPRVIDARSNLVTTARNLDRQIANVVSAVEKRFIAAQRQVRSIENDISREESKQFDLNAGRVSIKEIELTRNSDKRFYEEALSELRTYQEKDLQSVPMSISDYAATPKVPVKPKKTLLVMLGFLLSLAGASALFFVLESMKETVRGIADVEKKLGIPVFGIVPVIRGGLFGKKAIPLVPGDFDDKRGAFEEAIRTIRTSATVAELDEHNQVIMVTSSVPGEGKSTVASNLAYSMSKLENVVLIEADMRRPGLGRALNIRSDGLSELLSGETYLEDCLRLNAIGQLDIIPAGRIPETHLELLASPEFAELISLLRDRYDRIVIDLAPVQAVSDAIVVGKYADSAIYVIKADGTPMPVVRRGVDRLQEKGVNVTGAVISQVDLSKISSYGGDYYYQGYYDYYGYGESGKPKEKKRSLTRAGDSNELTAELTEAEDRRAASRISRIDDQRNRRDPSIVDVD